jgi:hypothetical protein
MEKRADTDVTLRRTSGKQHFNMGRLPPFRVIFAALYLIGLLGTTLYLLFRLK